MKLIGLDVGAKRIGVAKADSSVRIAIPVGVVLVNQGKEYVEIARIMRNVGASAVIVGMPRNVKGEETAQSDYVRDFACQLQKTIPGCKVRFQDETLTSVEAEKRLKASKKNYTKGDVDIESAVIILQDFIEHVANHMDAKTASDGAAEAPSSSDISSTKRSRVVTRNVDSADSANNTSGPTKRRKPKLALGILLGILAILLVSGAGGFIYYRTSLDPVSQISCPNAEGASGDESAAGATHPENCKKVDFNIAEGESTDSIASRLKEEGLIRSNLVFRVYSHIHGTAPQLKSGNYQLSAEMSTPEIIDTFVTGPVNNTFSFTILPGENLFEIQQKLLQLGYGQDEITAAFSKDYTNSTPELAQLLASKPADASLEGYLYGETYEFYKDDTVETILTRAMTELASVVQNNNLAAAYEAQGLTLHQGITLASIVQEESNATDYANVAQVLLLRLNQGMALGADATVKYAIDLIDRNRIDYDNNADALGVDSPYNTRKNTGLPPGPISNPGLSALLGVAHPSDADYLYFLTGDDGIMYYSHTEDEHLQKVSEYCKELCAIAL